MTIHCFIAASDDTCNHPEAPLKADISNAAQSDGFIFQFNHPKGAVADVPSLIDLSNKCPVEECRTLRKEEKGGDDHQQQTEVHNTKVPLAICTTEL